MKYLIMAILVIPSIANADGIKDASVYAVDRVNCHLTVPQTWVDAAIVQGMRERGLSYDEAVYVSAVKAKELGRRIDADNIKEQWCKWRKAN